LEVRLALSLPALDTVLTEEPCGQRNLRCFVAWADRAARQKAETQQEGERAGLDAHDGPFDEMFNL
jgi:hypothetical protein